MTENCSAEYDEHSGYRPTTTTWFEVLPARVIWWRVYRCECGARTSDHKVSAK